jgi:hypothetical protein
MRHISMISLQVDPANPGKLTLTATVSLYLDRCFVEALSDEVSAAIRRQAVRDIRKNPAVIKAISRAAQQLLLEKLGVKEEHGQEETLHG